MSEHISEWRSKYILYNKTVYILYSVLTNGLT